MKQISTQLAALFSARQFDYCGLYNFSLATGGSLNYSSGDIDILLSSTAPGAPSYWQNQTFSAGGNSGVGPYLDRSDNRAVAHWKVGVEVDQLSFDVIPGTSQVQSEPFLSAVRQGVFDGAELTFYGAYWPAVTLFASISNSATSLTVNDNSIFPASGNYFILVENELMKVTAGQGTNTWTVTRGVGGGAGAVAHQSGVKVTLLNNSFGAPLVPTGTIIKFVGRVAQVDCGRSIATFTVNSHLELLNQNMPRNLWQQSCVNTLFDTSCTLSVASFAVAGTALTGSASNSLNAMIAQATGYFDLGVITFTSGVNNGISRTVKQYIEGSPGTISLIAPFPNAPAAGDTFNAFPGCNKLQPTCQNKFSNLANFRGFPYVPENETAA